MVRFISILLLVPALAFGQSNMMVLMRIDTATSEESETRELAHYYFENDSTDESSYGNDFTENGILYWDNYYKQGSYSLRQTGDGNPYTPDLDITGNYITITGWVRAAYDTDNNQVFAVNDGATGVLFEMDYLGGDIDVYANGTKIAEGTNCILAETWHFVAFIYDKTTGDAYIYIDGTDETQDVGTDTGATLDGSWYFAKSEDDTNPLWGSMDDFRIFDEKLTKSETDWIMNHIGQSLKEPVE